MILLLCVSCGEKKEEANTYQSISTTEAVKMMEEESDHVIVDVRTKEEYDEGHIPGALNYPNEEIDESIREYLTDNDEILLVYCKSGVRSKEAAQKLADLGYTRVYEFGGIIDWKGEIEVTDKDKRVSGVSLIIEVDGYQMMAVLYDNPSTEELIKKLQEGRVTVEMSDYGNFEKVGRLPWTLPRSDEMITTEPGDIILYQGDQLSVYYDVNTYSFTRVGKIMGQTQDEIKEWLGEGDIEADLFLDYWDY